MDSRHRAEVAKRIVEFPGLRTFLVFLRGHRSLSAASIHRHLGVHEEQLDSWYRLFAEVFTRYMDEDTNVFQYTVTQGIDAFLSELNRLEPDFVPYEIPVDLALLEEGKEFDRTWFEMAHSRLNDVLDGDLSAVAMLASYIEMSGIKPEGFGLTRVALAEIVGNRYAVRLQKALADYRSGAQKHCFSEIRFCLEKLGVSYDSVGLSEQEFKHICRQADLAVVHVLADQFFSETLFKDLKEKVAWVRDKQTTHNFSYEEMKISEEELDVLSGDHPDKAFAYAMNMLSDLIDKYFWSDRDYLKHPLYFMLRHKLITKQRIKSIIPKQG